MNLGRLIRRTLPGLVTLVALAGLSGYFAYQLTEGGRSLAALYALDTEVATLQANAELQAERLAARKHQVALLRRDGLDLDLLDEQARLRLKLADPRDLVITDGDPAK